MDGISKVFNVTARTLSQLLTSIYICLEFCSNIANDEYSCLDAMFLEASEKFGKLFVISFFVERVNIHMICFCLELPLSLLNTRSTEVLCYLISLNYTLLTLLSAVCLVHTSSVHDSVPCVYCLTFCFKPLRVVYT